MTQAPLTLLPDIGDLLRVSPQYNAATLVEVVWRLGADEVLWLSGPDPEHPARDAFAAAGLRVVELSPDWAWAEAEYTELTAFLKQYPQGAARLRQAEGAERALGVLLRGEDRRAALTLPRLTAPDMLDGLRAYHAALARALEEGPGTRWQARRLDTLARAVQEQVRDGRVYVALVALDDVPGLLDRLPQAQLPDAATFTPGEASRRRALLDRALLLSEDDDLGALLSALEREEGDRLSSRAEAHYAAGSLRLAVGDVPGARRALEAAAHALTAERSLPGLVLARLGQLRDLQGERELAVRTYRAALALTYAPQAAREAAQSGLEAPFQLELDGG